MKTSMRLACTLLATATLAGSLALRANTATEPAALGEGWMTKHDEFVRAASKGGIDLLFLGDSIVEYWLKDTVKDIPRGKKVWDTEYAPLHAAGFGISGDRIQHLLWRIENGELEGIHPKVIVLMIGNNNAGMDSGKTTFRNTTQEIIEGVRCVLREIQLCQPTTRIILMGVLPRGRKDNPVWAQLRDVNEAISKWDDGERVRYLDILAGFLTPDGELSRELLPDLSHPSEKGFRVWADAMRPLLAEMMK